MQEIGTSFRWNTWIYWRESETLNYLYLQMGNVVYIFFPLFKVQLNDETEIKVPPFEAP